MAVMDRPLAGVGVQYAGFGIRFLAFLIDYILLAVVGGLLHTIHADAGSFVVGLVYYTVAIGSSFQASVGMRVVGLKVVTDGGVEDQPIGYGKAFIRWLVSIVSGLALGIGYLWIIWDPKKQAWHDKAAGTVVVRTT